MADVIAVTGPARCGKTERLLDRYRRELARFRPGTTLWLSPTQRSANAARERLLNAQLPACLDPGVMTFDQFAKALLASSPHPIQPIDSVQQRELLRRLIEDQARRNELQHFRAIAGKPGFIDLAAQFIRELKRLEIWPDEFHTACQKLGATNKDRELWRLYSDYQETLHRRHLFDAEGRFWSARELLKEGRAERFADLQLVVVDGFTDFTRTQHEMLEILAERVGELLISLPLEAPLMRQELFAKTQATLDRLRQQHPRLRTEMLGARTGMDSWPIMAHLQAELFQNPRHPRPAPAVERVEILAAGSALGEVEWLARRIKSLLIDGDPGDHRPVKPGEIAIVFRSPDDYAPLVREVFDRFGLPAAVETGRRLKDSRALAALIALLRLHVEDWPFRQLLAVLNNNFFHPTWPEAVPQALSAAELVIRELQLPQGRLALVDRIRRWARLDDPTESAADNDSDPTWPARLAERRRRAELAGPLFERLSRCLTALPERDATPQELLAALDRLAAETGWLRAMNAADERSGQSIHERAAWDRLRNAIAGCQSLSDCLEEPPQRRSLEAWLDFIQEAAASEQLPGSHDETGRVRVLAAASARALDIPYLFFAGLSEKSFPPPARDDRLYSEAETRRLAVEGGLPLVLRPERNQEEMLLFYEVLTRASRRLYLSYPALDSKAQELLPSPYLLEVERVCGRGCIPKQMAEDLSPLPPASQPPLCEADFRLLAVSRALAGNGELLAALQRAGEDYDQPSIERASDIKSHSKTVRRPLRGDKPRGSELASPEPRGLSPRKGIACDVSDAITAGLLLTDERSQRDRFGPFEGLFQSDAVRKQLSDRFGPERLWSATELEAYAACPYRFLMERVLSLKPLVEHELATDYGRRGQMLHGVLAELHRRLNTARGGVPTLPSALADDEFQRHYEEALAALMTFADSDDALSAALREIDQRMIRLWTQKYRVQHDGYQQLWRECDTPPLPAHFEVSFGLDPPDADPRSSPAPLVLECGDEMVRLSGRIDRIDVGRVAGQNVFNVLDYKSSGKRPSRSKQSGELDGTSLQLELYSIAAAEILLADQQAVPWRAGYWHVQLDGYKSWLEFHEQAEGGLQPTAAWQAQRRALLAKVGELVRGIRHGDFPVYNRDDKCGSRCPFNTVCRINHIRSLEKTWPPLPAQPD